MPIDADTDKALKDIGASIANLQGKLAELQAAHAPKADVDELKKFIAELKTERAKAAEAARKAAEVPAPNPNPAPVPESDFTEFWKFTE